MGFETLRPQQHVEAQQKYTFNDEYSGGLLELPPVLYEIKYLHTTASFSISTFTSISHILGIGSLPLYACLWPLHFVLIASVR
jgi:hypothetical protein